MRRCVEMSVLLALVMSSSVACVGPRLARCPADGGEPWVELESDHFLLQTDLPPKQARKAVEYLERTRAGMITAAWPAALQREMPKLTVHVLADSSQFENIFPRRVAGVFARTDEPFIVLHGEPDSWDQRFTGLSEATSSTVKHELAHYLSSYFLLRQPRWLSEGLAQFLETLHLSPDGKTAVLGKPHLDALTGMRTLLDGVTRGVVEDFSMKDVLAWEGSSSSEELADWEVAGRYWGSWLLVYWLYNTRPVDFGLLQERLARGEDPRRATLAVFPELYSKKLDQRLFDYLKTGSSQEFTVQVPLGAMSFSERGLDDAEVHAVRAKLSLLASRMAEEGSDDRLEMAKGEIDEALRQDPKSLLALEAKLADTPAEERLGLARKAVEAHPHEGGAWLMLASALKADTSARAEREKALRRAMVLSHRDSQVLNELAWFYVTERRYAEAFPLAQRAVNLAPWSSPVLDTYAMAAAGVGHCAEAALAEQRALDLLQEHPDPKLEKMLRERLRAFSQPSCKPPEVR